MKMSTVQCEQYHTPMTVLSASGNSGDWNYVCGVYVYLFLLLIEHKMHYTRLNQHVNNHFIFTQHGLAQFEIEKNFFISSYLPTYSLQCSKNKYTTFFDRLPPMKSRINKIDHCCRNFFLLSKQRMSHLFLLLHQHEKLRIIYLEIPATYCLSQRPERNFKWH